MDDWIVAAEQALSAAWGVPVTCAIATTLREEGRNRVWRLTVGGGPVASVILKACVGEEGRPYVLGDPTPQGAFRRFCNEAAGARMLEAIGMGANTYAADIERGFCLLEDLGEGEPVSARLLGDDPAAATSALLAYARSLGDMHAATTALEPRWTELLAEQGLGDGDDGPMAMPWRLAPMAIPAFCRELEIEPPEGLEAELAGIAQALDAPGPYLAFTPTDCCPDNQFLRGERVVFFDCEGAAMHHALLDASYFLAPFPTCWCCAALPEGLAERLLAAYRESFPCGPDFDDQLTIALTSWLTRGLLVRQELNWLEVDRPWGLSTVRQRVRALIETLLARPNLGRIAPALARVLSEIDGALRIRWADVPPMPLYPAFGAAR